MGIDERRHDSLRLVLGSLTAGLYAAGVFFAYRAAVGEGMGAVYGLLAALASLSAVAATVLLWREGAQRRRRRGEEAAPVTPVEWSGASFLREVEARSGTSVGACYQCHKCSSGCPVGPDMDLLSSQVMRLVHLGAERAVLESRAIWLCASCEACTTRCPMGIDVAAVMDALRMLAVARESALRDARARQFGASFLQSVRRHGRAFEAGLMAFYKLRSGDLFSDLDKARQMWAKGKLSALPKRVAAPGKVREVFERSNREEVGR